MGLGLDKDLPNHEGLAITYENAGWQKAGWTKVDWAKASLDIYWFKESFKEAVENVEAIRFDVSTYWPDYPRKGVTAWEIEYITKHPHLLEKTMFIKDGQPVTWTPAGFVKQ